jgi:hypothetical protein
VASALDRSTAALETGTTLAAETSALTDVVAALSVSAGTDGTTTAAGPADGSDAEPTATDEQPTDGTETSTQFPGFGVLVAVVALFVFVFAGRLRGRVDR